MIRIWAKIEKNHKLGKNIIYESLDNFKPETFYLHVQEICNRLDIPTPVIIESHIKNFDKFNTTTFLERDFIESIDFDKLILEHVVDKK